MHADVDHAHAPHHGASHDHAHERYTDRPHPGFVLLDIGGDVGALIVHAGAELSGVEVEISATGRDHERSHKDVLERSIDGRPAHTAVFDQLTAGTYTLWTHGVARTRDVEVRGGEIAELDWTAETGNELRLTAATSNRGERDAQRRDRL